MVFAVQTGGTLSQKMFFAPAHAQRSKSISFCFTETAESSYSSAAMDDDWFGGLFDFLKLTPEEQRERIRRVCEEKEAEWRENPEPGLALRPRVRERLLQQQQAVNDGERGVRLEELLCFETDWWEDPVLEIQILRNANDQLMSFHPELAWLALERIYRLRPQRSFSLRPLKGGMMGIFKVDWQEYRILCLPLPNDLLLVCDISRASELFEPAI